MHAYICNSLYTVVFISWIYDLPAQLTVGMLKLYLELENKIRQNVYVYMDMYATYVFHRSTIGLNKR